MKTDRRLEIQPVPRAVFAQIDRWTKSWMYHLKIRETRGTPVRIVEATFDVMSKDGLLRRDVYDAERLAQRIKPMTVMRHWLRPSGYERKGSNRIPANGERRMSDIFYSHHKTLPVVGMRHVFRCEEENGKTFRVRFDLPVMESKQRTKLRLPFDGRWIMALGFEFFEHHGRGGGLGNDFVKLGPDSLPFRGWGTRAADWYCYGEDVLAPADGVVRAVRRDSRDNIPLTPVTDRGDFNYLHIEHAHKEHSFLAHLKHNTICVGVGQRVKAGQKLGECGNTGITTVCPHVHLGFRVGEYPVPPMLHGVRVFYPVELEDRVYAPTSVAEKAVLRHGQIVENAK